jgi:DNA invertase Pin-like site-specific DNA recombinase
MPVTIVSWLAGSPTYTRDQFNKVRAMLGQQVVGIAQIAKETGLTRHTVYRVKGDPGGAEGVWVAWACEYAPRCCQPRNLSSTK